MKKSPSIVLKNQFETGVGKKQHVKELDKFIDYITRKEALEIDDYNYSSKETEELKRIEDALAKMELETNNTIVKDVLQMEKYIDYMTRTKAIKIDNKNEEVINGAFSNSKRFITKDDVIKIKQEVVQAKKNNSVMYQDVISFNNDFLTENGFYDKKTKKLDEDSMYKAVTNMANTCIKKEDLKDTFWFATIHRNTDNIHIHMTMMERRNTRKVIEWDGEKQARGLRKQSTIDDMKFSFGNTLLNCTDELTTISTLRKNIPDFYKKEFKDLLLDLYINKVNYDKNDRFLEEKIEKAATSIQVNTKGYNALPDDTKKNIDEIVDHITKNNSMKKEYLANAKAIDTLYSETYGDSHKNGSFYANKKQVLKERLGNAFVSQVKSLKKEQKINLKSEQLKDFMQDKKINLIKNKETDYHFKTKSGYENNKKFIAYKKNKELEKQEKDLIYSQKINCYKNKKALRTIHRSINDNSNMYRAEQDYEEVKRKIEQEQCVNKYNFEM